MNRSSKTKMKRLQRRLFWCFLLLFHVALVFSVVHDFRHGANYLPIHIRETPGSPDLSIEKIFTLSPWGSRTDLIEKKDEWSFPEGLPRLISKVLVNFAEPSPSQPVFFEYTHTDPASADWHRCPARPGEIGSSEWELEIPKKSSRILPGFREVVNWRGDVALIFRPALSLFYSFLLLYLLATFFLKHHAAIRNAIKTTVSAFRPVRGEWIGGIVLFAIFLLLNWRNADLETVLFRQFDEHSLLTRIEDGNFFGLYYGTVFNLTAFPFLAPGLALDRFDISIIGARMHSALWVMGCALVWRRLFAEQSKGVSLVLVTVIPFTIPFFWISGTFFHPDAMMTCLLLASAFWLFRAEEDSETSYHLFVAFLAAAVATKMHALMFVPVLPIYLVVRFVKERSWSQVRNRSISALIISTATCLIFEPRLFFPSFAIELIDAFQFQLWTNKTGYTVLNQFQVPLSTKLDTLETLYSPMIWIAALTLAAVAALSFIPTSKRLPGLAWLAACVTVWGYYAFFLNKDWPYYYLSPLILTVAVTLKVILAATKTRSQSLALIGLALSAQWFVPFSSWGRVIHDAFMPPGVLVAELRDTASKLKRNLEDLPLKGDVLIAYGIPLDYRALGLDSTQFHGLSTEAVEKINAGDYAFLDERSIDAVIFSDSAELADAEILGKFRTDLPRFGYELIIETPKALLFRRS